MDLGVYTQQLFSKFCFGMPPSVKKKLATNTAFMDVRPKRNEGRISQFDIIRTQKSNFSRKIHCHSEVRSIEYIRHGNVAYFPAVQGQNRRLTSFIPLLDRFTT